MAGWLLALAAVGAAWVAEIVKGPRLFELACALAVAASLGFGAKIAYGRDWSWLGLATGGAIAVVIISGAAAWFSQFFVPVPGGSGGAMGELLVGLPFTVLFSGIAGLPVTATALALGTAAGAVTRRLKPPTPGRPGSSGQPGPLIWPPPQSVSRASPWGAAP
jgi:hypothetical protein